MWVQPALCHSLYHRDIFFTGVCLQMHHLNHSKTSPNAKGRCVWGLACLGRATVSVVSMAFLSFPDVLPQTPFGVATYRQHSCTDGWYSKTYPGHLKRRHQRAEKCSILWVPLPSPGFLGEVSAWPFAAQGVGSSPRRGNEVTVNVCPVGSHSDALHFKDGVGHSQMKTHTWRTGALEDKPHLLVRGTYHLQGPLTRPLPLSLCSTCNRWSFLWLTNTITLGRGRSQWERCSPFQLVVLLLRFSMCSLVKYDN